VKNKKHTSSVTTGTPLSTGIPRAIGFNGFLRALPGEPGFVATIPGMMPKHRRRVDISVGISGPHDFAVCIQRRSSGGTACVHRIPHPTFVTIASAPLSSTGRANSYR
jgi:hypothetical protein